MEAAQEFSGESGAAAEAWSLKVERSPGMQGISPHLLKTHCVTLCCPFQRTQFLSLRIEGFQSRGIYYPDGRQDHLSPRPLLLRVEVWSIVLSRLGGVGWARRINHPSRPW